MKSKMSKSEIKKKIDFFFEHIKDKTPEEVKKIKRLAASHNIHLGARRKKFCKKCLTPYKNPKIRIKKDLLSMMCKNCGHISMWKIKLS